jgi:hypothetical protein
MNMKFPSIPWTNGPVREIRVYINDVLVGISVPEPMILSGGILPACRRLGINAFDIKPLEIGITGFLPDLWHGKGGRLRVEVFNGQGFEPLKIGDIWMVGASVLHCESSNIEISFREI